MTAGQLARAGAFLRAARLIRRGLSDARIVESLDAEWPNQPLDVVLHVLRLAHQGVAAADALAEAGPGGSVPADALPLISNLP